MSIEVRNVGAGEDPGLPFWFDWDSQVVTSENGEYSFPPFPFRPGWSVRIRVESRGHVNLESELGDVRGRPRVDLTMVRGLTVRGRALDPEGEPRAGVSVYCAFRKQVTSEAGRFEFGAFHVTVARSASRDAARCGRRAGGAHGGPRAESRGR